MDASPYTGVSKGLPMRRELDICGQWIGLAIEDT